MDSGRERSSSTVGRPSPCIENVIPCKKGKCSRPQKAYINTPANAHIRPPSIFSTPSHHPSLRPPRLHCLFTPPVHCQSDTIRRGSPRHHAFPIRDEPIAWRQSTPSHSPRRNNGLLFSFVRVPTRRRSPPPVLRAPLASETHPANFCTQTVQKPLLLLTTRALDNARQISERNT